MEVASVPGMLGFEDLEREIAEGRIDTVVTALPDLYGRLVPHPIFGGYNFSISLIKFNT